MKTLIIDNYDSFTFNLFQLIAVINGEEPIVIRNDQLAWREVSDLPFDNIVISPGPGTPERESDFGICKTALLAAKVPILGVCLGHQGMGFYYGAKIRCAPQPMHGRLSAVYHHSAHLFEGIPQGFQAVRYHSLIVDDRLPDCLECTAWTADGILMGIRHRSLPRWGVQFHPESVCTEHGERLLRNFRDLTLLHGRPRLSAPGAALEASARRISVVPAASNQETIISTGFRVQSRKLAIFPETEQVFAQMFGAEPLSFWLDSSRAEPELSRYTFLGSAAGPRGALICYDATKHEVTKTANGETHRFRESIYTYLDRELQRRHALCPDLPFDFNGGFVGYFGYELKKESGVSRWVTTAPTHHHPSEYPDAMFVFADRLLAFDHDEKVTYLVAVVAPGEEALATAWFHETTHRLCENRSPKTPTSQFDQGPITFRLGHSRSAYLEDIARCKRYIRDGETYEVCLTNRIHVQGIHDPLSVYLHLRHINPAPYSAFLRFGDVAVMCSSPERYLRIDRQGWIESKPIKGTRPRGSSPEQDHAQREDLRSHEKDRTENLMIVDLLRNDLGTVCNVGSVHVPKLMDVESYQTVHQLVSTIRGQLRSGFRAVECIRCAFPAGSMTGAPKIRTMDIIEELEAEPRGVYSGAIGFLGLNGTADFNVVIRTLVHTPQSTTIGVGGAIVALSDPESEFEETLLKARALIQAVVATARGEIGPEAYELALRQLREHGFTRF